MINSRRSCATAVLLGLSTLPAHAGSGDSVSLTYNIEFAGLNALQVKYHADIQPIGYKSKASIETRGLVSMFSGYELTMASSGTFRDVRAMPASYTSIAQKSSKKARFDLSWGADDLPQQHQLSDNDLPVRQDIDSALTTTTMDPLSALLSLGGQIEKPCQGSQRIFSGRDVYDLRFSFEKTAQVGRSQGGVYRGTAYQCHMLYVPVAGRAAKKFKRSGSKPPGFTVWFAPVQSEILGRQILFPVAASGKLEGRSFRAFASQATIAGHAFNAASTAGN